MRLVSISNRTNRYLLINDASVNDTFNHFMAQKGWDEERAYGRSMLYSKSGREMLVKKTDLLNGYCIFEWMDENYVICKAV